ncbi:MAG: methyltransferase regulatory domain-containing protein [Campylobacter sp.]
MKVLGSAELLNTHIEQILKAGDSYILHEYLEEFNQPFYFREFADSLDKHGLVYLSETNLQDVLRAKLGIKEFDKFIDENFTNRIDKEQAMDFFTSKIFRSSMIMHKENLKNHSTNVEIGVDELSKLHISAHFEKKDDGKYKNRLNDDVKEQYNWLYEVFNDLYPASVNFKDLAALLKDDEKMLQSAYFGLFEILAANCAEFSIYPQEKIVYEPKKTRLKQNYIAYFEYFSKTDESVISVADSLGINIYLTQLDCFLALNFNGENSLEDIEKILHKLIKNKVVNLSDENDKPIRTNDPKTIKQIAKKMVENLALKLCHYKFLETIS